MPRSTAETLKQIQKQGLSISIISADSPKPVAVEAGSKELRSKQISVVSESLPNNSRSASSTENKPTVSQVRQITNASVETRSSSQSALSTNQTAQTGANSKLPPVSSTSEMKLQSSVRLNNPNSVENKSQFSASNRNVQIEKNQSNVRHIQNASASEIKAQSNRNMLTFSGVLDNKPNRNIPIEAKTSVAHSRTQNQTVAAENKTILNQSRLTVASPPLEGKTNSNPGRLLSQSNSTTGLDKSIGNRNQLLVTEIKTPNQCKIIPVKQSDTKTASAPKGHQNVKVISQTRSISQFQPNAVRVTGVNNNGKSIGNKSSINALSERALNNPFRVASTLVENDEKPVYKVTKVIPNAASSESQSFQPKKILVPLKSENKADNQSVKISELPPELLQKPVQIENSPEAHPTNVNIMPKAAAKRVAVASSTPVSGNKRKYIKIMPSVSDQSGSQSDINTLSSDESPVKEKKVFNLRSITPGLTITPVQTSTPSTSAKKTAESNQNTIVMCPSCNQFSHSTTSCDSCHKVFTTTPVRYHLKNAQTDSASIVVTQNVTTSIEKSMKIVYHVSPNQNFKFQQTQQVIKVSPRRGRPKRRYVEPVCYTLSSDEEEALPYEPIPEDMNSQILYSHELEENPESEHSSNSDMPEENLEFDDPHFPGVTRIKDQFVSKHGLNLEMDERDEEEEMDDEEMEHEMDSEEELMEEDIGVEQPEFDEEDEELEEEDEEEEIPPDEEDRYIPPFNKLQSAMPKKIVLKCRSIRIGSFKIHPEQHTDSLLVTVTDRSLHFVAPLVTDGKSSVQLTLTPSDTESMMIHFGKCLPIIFVLTTEKFGDYVRRTLHMTKSHSDLFLPKSNDFKKNKLTFLIDTLTDDQRSFMRGIFPGPDKLHEIDQKEANEILVKSTPNTNVVKLTQESQVSSLPTPQVGITVAGLPPGLSTQALSITKVTVKPGPPAPVVKILTYPPPPQTGGIAINTADLATLEEGEFLNDAILDFYLKLV